MLGSISSILVLLIVRILILVVIGGRTCVLASLAVRHCVGIVGVLYDRVKSRLVELVDAPGGSPARRRGVVDADCAHEEDAVNQEARDGSRRLS